MFETDIRKAHKIANNNCLKSGIAMKNGGYSSGCRWEHIGTIHRMQVGHS
jgi:hypothetical protein